jgi:hypothetical protein
MARNLIKGVWKVPRASADRVRGIAQEYGASKRTILLVRRALLVAAATPSSRQLVNSDNPLPNR